MPLVRFHHCSNLCSCSPFVLEQIDKQTTGQQRKKKSHHRGEDEIKASKCSLRPLRTVTCLRACLFTSCCYRILQNPTRCTDQRRCLYDTHITNPALDLNEKISNGNQRMSSVMQILSHVGCDTL